MSDLRSYTMVARQALLAPALLDAVPAAFAESPDVTRTSATYQFISTAEVIRALLDAGFQATRARQAKVRRNHSADHARHMIRFSFVREELSLLDAIPELILTNAHNGTATYCLRAGLYRPVCTNGMMTEIGEFGVVHVPHRGNIVHNVVESALKIAAQFDKIGEVVRRMGSRLLSDSERWDLAASALKLRYPKPDQHVPLTADQLLLPRRNADYGNSLWLTYNVLQENCCAGGLQGRSAQGRATRTRRINAIREDVRLNVGLWNHAVTLLG